MNKEDLEAQRIMQEIQNKTHYIGPSVNMSGSECPECGFYHPPLRQGEKCPNRKIEVSGISEGEVNSYVASIKNILASQIEKKSFKNPKKVFQLAIVELTKFLESYNE